MHADVIWLTALTLSFPALSQCEPLFVLMAPNLLRVGSEENAFVEVQEYAGESLSVDIMVMDFPAKTKVIFSGAVKLSEENSYQALQEILMPEHYFEKETKQKQYVYLQAIFPKLKLEKVIQVSFQSGYIFIQTDRTIYSPLDSVSYRVFALNAGLKPKKCRVSVEVLDPDGIIVGKSTLWIDKKIGHGLFKIPEIASVGTWKIISRIYNTQHIFTYKFEVKENAQPNFAIKVMPKKNFFYIDDTELSVEVTARYLYGEDVSGKAFVVFGVLTEDGEKKSIPASLQKVNIESGKGKARLTKAHILTVFPDIAQLVSLSLYVSISVLTDSGTKMAAEKKGILIVTSPYTVHFEKTANYFKPGLPFEVVVYSTNPDNTPAKNVDLEVTPGPVFGRTGENGAAKFQINTPQEATTLQVNVRTKAPGIAEERQAVAQMTALPYRTQGDSKNYILISVMSQDIQIGNSLNIHIVFSNSPSHQDQINHLTYLVLSKGQLIRAARYKRLTGQSIIAINDKVTEDMAPSFRIVAYYHLGTEVVSDSIWLDVKDTCVGTLEVTATDPKDVYKPRHPFSLTITGDPGATVGLVAVDKGVYVLNNKHRLTQTKIWEIVEKHDIGCAPGSGADSMGVFYDAGLAFQSNLGGTSRRLEPNCSTLSRSRRRRSLGEEDDHYISDIDIVSRTLFPGSWLWEDMMLPVCPRGKPGCKSTSITRRSLLKDTVTTWEITTISLSKTHGICVSEPFEMTVMKNFFIDLKLPYAAVRNEQLEIEAVIHNYLYKQIKVRVELMETEHVCSAASKQWKYRVPEVLVDSMSSRAVPFVIIPMALGLHPIEVKAAANDSFNWDGVRKYLLVVPEGARYRQMTRIVLNPSLYGSVQKVEINAQRPTFQVPGSDGYHYISVTGEQQSQTIQEVIRGSSISHLIAQPRGNGEQNIMSMTGPVIATHYLDNTNQWDEVAQDRQDALKFIAIGYTQQLAYRNKDGAYSVSTGRNPSSWLTAYVVKVFSLANPIKEEGLCNALKWLFLNTRLPDGSFKEVGHVDHGEMLGGVQGKDNDVSMTAFILIAIQEARYICWRTVYALQDGLKKSHEFLSSQIKSLTDPYAVALTAYALANEGKHQIEILNHFSSGKTHWQVSNSPLITLEATGYALMALVRAKEFDQAARVVEWLTEQKFYGGGDPKSIQATIIVLQAVALFTREATAATEQSKTELRVHFTLARPVTWVFHGNSFPIIRSQRVHLGTNVTLIAEGSGKASLLVVTAYNALPKEKEEDCKNFELNVALEKEPRASDENVLESYKLTIDMKYLSSSDAPISVLDVTLLTGFIADTRDLEKLTAGRDSNLLKPKMDEQMSKMGSLIFYLDKVSHQRHDRLAFRIHKMSNVGLLQPAAVILYEYDSLESGCMKFYHPERRGGALNRICHEDVCRCAEESCSYKGKEKGELSHMTIACSAGMGYVYKVRVLRADLTQTIDRFTVLLESIIIEGAEPVVEGKNCTFLAPPHCREVMGWVVGRTYLVMGMFNSLIKGKDTVAYMLGAGTWAEYWPTEAECREPVNWNTCRSLTEFTEDLQINGCLI